MEGEHLRHFAYLKAASLITGLVPTILALGGTFLTYSWAHGRAPPLADSFVRLCPPSILVSR